MSSGAGACTVAVGVCVLALAAYTVLALRRFSFDETVHALINASFALCPLDAWIPVGVKSIVRFFSCEGTVLP